MDLVATLQFRILITFRRSDDAVDDWLLAISMMLLVTLCHNICKP